MNQESALRSEYDIPPTIRAKLLSPNSAEVECPVSDGLSNSQVYRCRSPQGMLCLRRWPKSTYGLERLNSIREAVQATHRNGVYILPGYLQDQDGASFVPHRDSYWELTHWRPGQANYLEAPAAGKRQSAMHALASIHRIWRAGRVRAESPAISRRIALLEKWQRMDVLRNASHRLPTNERNSNTTSPELVTALARETIEALGRHGPRVHYWLSAFSQQSQETHFVLRDIWSAHVLFTGETVSGIVDLGAAGIDEPATDLARLLGSIEPRSAENWIEAMGHYQAFQPDIDRARVLVLDYASCLLSAVQWMQWLVVERLEFPAETKSLVERWRSFLIRIDEFPWHDMLCEFTASAQRILPPNSIPTPMVIRRKYR